VPLLRLALHLGHLLGVVLLQVLPLALHLDHWVAWVVVQLMPSVQGLV